MRVDPELRWVLLRAFGPAQAPWTARVDGARVAALAGDLGLLERIAARIPSPLLVSELGAEVARAWALSHLQVLARMRGLYALVPELAALAAAESISIVLLKFAALHAGGYLAEGSRAAGDVDVLVPAREAGRAAAALARRGFVAAEPTLADHHHLPPLHDHAGRMVELHTRLPGVRSPGQSRFVGFETLMRAGALEPVAGSGAACFTLRRDVLAAHLVVHGFAQHGGADIYPLTRALADLIDLLPGERQTTGTPAASWIAAALPASELRTILVLCDALASGALEALETQPALRAERALLDHVLASALDPDYRRSIAVGHLFHGLSDEPRGWRFLKTLQALAAPTKAQLAARLGLPSARSISLRLRLAHAAALTARLPDLARAALRAAWRRLRRFGGRHA